MKVMGSIQDLLRLMYSVNSGLAELGFGGVLGDVFGKLGQRLRHGRGLVELPGMLEDRVSLGVELLRFGQIVWTGPAARFDPDELVSPARGAELDP